MGDKKYSKLILNECHRKRTPVTVFLINGFQMRGIIDAFDDDVIILTCDKKQNMIFRHAISTINPSNPVTLPEN